MMIVSEKSAAPAKRGHSSLSPPYSGFARIYDNAVGDAVFPLIFRSFESALKKYRIPFASAADIGCGTGRFLKYLRSYGVPVYGVDRSASMLKVAEQRNRDEGVQLLRQDMRSFKLPHPVDLITCNFDTLNYILSESDLARTVSRCHANLTKRGHFIFDLITGSRSEQGWQRVIQRIRMPGVVSNWLVTWSAKDRASIVKMVHHFKDRAGISRVVTEIHKQRWYQMPLVNRILSKSNFTLRGIHEAETFAPATAHTFWAKYVAHKEGTKVYD